MIDFSVTKYNMNEKVKSFFDLTVDKCIIGIELKTTMKCYIYTGMKKLPNGSNTALELYYSRGSSHNHLTSRFNISTPKYNRVLYF